MSDAIEEQLELFKEHLRNKGLRMTRQRELIVQTFLQSDGHVSTDELHDLVREEDRNIGYATVFRTLKALNECGLARETDLDDGRARFEPLYKRPRHHHIVCLECNNTIEFFSPDLEQIQEDIIAQYNFKPVRNRFQIYGVCEDCQNEQASSQPAIDTDLIFARDALQIAMKTEQRGVDFYKTAAELVSHQATRKTFLEMLEEEQEHYDGLKKEWDRLTSEHPEVLEAPVFLHFDYEALKKIFPSRDEIKKKLNAELTEEEALRLAMQMEKDARDFFRSYAQDFNDTKGRDIFLQFAKEEEDHYAIIRETYDQVLADPSS